MFSVSNVLPRPLLCPFSVSSFLSSVGSEPFAAAVAFMLRQEHPVALRYAAWKTALAIPQTIAFPSLRFAPSSSPLPSLPSAPSPLAGFAPPSGFPLGGRGYLYPVQGVATAVDRKLLLLFEPDRPARPGTQAIRAAAAPPALRRRPPPPRGQQWRRGQRGGRAGSGREAPQRAAAAAIAVPAGRVVHCARSAGLRAARLPRQPPVTGGRTAECGLRLGDCPQGVARGPTVGAR